MSRRLLSVLLALVLVGAGAGASWAVLKVQSATTASASTGTWSLVVKRTNESATARPLLVNSGSDLSTLNSGTTPLYVDYFNNGSTTLPTVDRISSTMTVTTKGSGTARIYFCPNNWRNDHTCADATPVEVAASGSTTTIDPNIIPRAVNNTKRLQVRVENGTLTELLVSTTLTLNTN